MTEPARRRSHRFDPGILLAIAIGGAAGAPARYEIALAVHSAKDTFPWATFWTNLSGAFLLGVVLTSIIERGAPSRFARPLLATGFLGAFTTFSTLAVETVLLVKDGEAALGATYLVGSVSAGLIVAYAGIVVARALASRPIR